jgi:Xaa-Pro aminopeptidase
MDELMAPFSRVPLLRLITALGLGLLATNVQAQTLSTPPQPVAALPGAGRPIEIEATRARREALSHRVGPGIIAIPAASARDLESEVLQDNDFRQNDYFFYLTGLETPDAWLVIISSDGPTASHLFLPARNPGAEAWTGRQLGPGDVAASLTGIANVHPLDSLDHWLANTQRSVMGPLYTLLYAETSTNQRIQSWVDAANGLDIRNVVPVLDSARVVKDDAELTRLRRAIDMTTNAQRAAMQDVRPGMYEYEIEATIEYTFRRLGADRVGFPSIVGSGPNSTTLHYDVNRRQTQPGDLVVMDVGAEYGQYTADVTRTVPVDGRFTTRQRAVYELVLGAQQVAIDAARPGVTIGDLNRIARRYIEQHSGDLCGGTSCNRFFIHGLSHWLGMRVHDVGDYSMPLAPGMVLTVEPGVYIPDEQLGVRIEDDVLITETGAVILSSGAPRRVDEIERLMRGHPIIP